MEVILYKWSSFDNLKTHELLFKIRTLNITYINFSKRHPWLSGRGCTTNVYKLDAYAAMDPDRRRMRLGCLLPNHLTWQVDRDIACVLDQKPTFQIQKANPFILPQNLLISVKQGFIWNHKNKRIFNEAGSFKVSKKFIQISVGLNKIGNRKYYYKHILP